MLFAHLKRILGLDRLRLRGPSGAKDEFLLAATAQNLRKLAKLIPFPAPVFATSGGKARLCLADSRRSRVSRSPEDRVFQRNPSTPDVQSLGTSVARRVELMRSKLLLGTVGPGALRP